MTKYWQTLLTEWRKEGREGFTLPYLIGAQKYLRKQTNALGIKELFIEMVENNEIAVYLK